MPKALSLVLALFLAVGAFGAPDFTHVIEAAYQDILKRPVDPSGLEHYQRLMAEGMTEAALRESLIRSKEYAERFPGPEPTPPPPPPGSGLALHVEGSRFVNGNGEVVKLQGAVICCDAGDTTEDDAIIRGWPWIDEATIDLFADHAVNLTHIRMGPFSAGEPNPVQVYARTADGRYDLDRWDDSAWARLRQILTHAQSRGEYIEVDLIDVWGLHHEVTPWSSARNVNGIEAGHLGVVAAAPQPVHERFVRKVVAETCGFDIVLYQDGNECHKGCSTAWTFGLRAIVRDELARRACPARPFGTNSHRGDIEAGVDYINRHDRFAQARDERPVGVNEYSEVSPSHVIEQVRTSRANGTSYAYWRGGHTNRQWRNTLAAIKEIVTGQPVPRPFPIPDSCPKLVRWGSKIHNVMNGGFGQVPNPVRGGYVVVDSTPRFGSGRGLPCNSEHDNCDGRSCEPKDGGSWTLLEGNANVKVQSDGYQARVGPLSSGHYRLQVCSRPGARDAEEGKPLDIANGQVCSVTEWDVP